MLGGRQLCGSFSNVTIEVGNTLFIIVTSQSFNLSEYLFLDILLTHLLQNYPYTVSRPVEFPDALFDIFLW